MTNKDLIAAIRKFKGDIVVGMIVRNEVLYVRAYKNDVIKTLAGQPDDIATATERYGALYIDNN